MSELISGKEAKIAWANGIAVQVDIGGGVFGDITGDDLLSVFDYKTNKFRLKPNTVNLNGVEVGQLRTAMWCINCPKEVTLEFKTEDDAHHFYANAMKIFNGV